MHARITLIVAFVVCLGAMSACGTPDSAWRRALGKDPTARGQGAGKTEPEQAGPNEARKKRTGNAAQDVPTLPKLPDLPQDDGSGAGINATSKTASQGAGTKASSKKPGKPSTIGVAETETSEARGAGQSEGGGDEPSSTEHKRVTPKSLLGVWTVTRIVRPQDYGGRVSGWMTFTRAFVSMHLYQAGPNDESKPRLQSAMRSYRIEGEQLVTQSMMGFRNGPKPGEILLERGGLSERRRVALLAPGLLRIYSGPRSFLELKRVSKL